MPTLSPFLCFFMLWTEFSRGQKKHLAKETMKTLATQITFFAYSIPLNVRYVNFAETLAFCHYETGSKVIKTYERFNNAKNTMVVELNFPEMLRLTNHKPLWRGLCIWVVNQQPLYKQMHISLYVILHGSFYWNHFPGHGCSKAN